MNTFTLTEPVKYKGVEKWIVYIFENGLLTGEAGMGNSPEDATKNAQAKIEAMPEK